MNMLRHKDTLLDEMNNKILVIERLDSKKTPTFSIYLTDIEKELIKEYVRLRKIFSNRLQLKNLIIGEYINRIEGGNEQ